MDPVVTARIKRLLIRNRAYRSDMARSPRAGALYFAELAMEARLIADAEDGLQPNAKRLVMEVTPEWVGASTAHRILKDWIATGMVEAEEDPEDRRALLIRPTPAMLARASSRWSLIADDLPEARPLPPSRLVG